MVCLLFYLQIHSRARLAPTGFMVGAEFEFDTCPVGAWLAREE
jgi:hypothetical protein